jgi:hypothetical protein
MSKVASTPLILILGRIILATIVEGLIGLLSLLTAHALFTHAAWAWREAVWILALTLLGVLVGRRAVSSGSSPFQVLTVAYHRVMLAAILAGLAFLLFPGVRATLRETEHEMPSRLVPDQAKG